MVKKKLGREKKQRSEKNTLSEKHPDNLLGLSFKELWNSHKYRIAPFFPSWLEGQGLQGNKHTGQSLAGKIVPLEILWSGIIYRSRNIIKLISFVSLEDWKSRELLG